MTIDEAIEFEYDFVDSGMSIDSDYHIQLAEWLEELKTYKSLFDKTKTTNPMYELGYNKAIESVAIMLEKKLADTTFRTKIVNDVRRMKEGGKE